MDYIRWCNLQKKNMIHLPHLIWPLSWTNFKTTNLTRAKFYEQDKMYQYKTNQNVNKKCIIWFEIISKCISYIYHSNGQKLNRPTRNQCKVIYFKLVMLNWILETHCDPFLIMTIWTFMILSFWPWGIIVLWPWPLCNWNLYIYNYYALKMLLLWQEIKLQTKRKTNIIKNKS